MSDPIYPDANDNILLRRIAGFLRSITTLGGLTVNTTLSGGDIQLGAVEIKDATTDNRLSVSASGAALVTSSTLATVAKQPALGVSGTPSADVISVQGFGFRGTTTVTRPANTTPYSIGDVVGGALTIATIGPANGHIYITDSKLMLNLSALPAGMSSFTLHLYNVTPPSAIADNAPFTLGSGDRAAYMGFVNLGSPALLGVGTQTPYVIQTGLNQGFTMPAGTSLYAYLVTATAYTPAANSETYDLTLKSISV